MEPTVERTSKKIKILSVIAAMLIMGITTISTLAVLLLNKDTIYSKVYIETVDVSNLTKEEALRKVENLYVKDLEGRKVNIVYEDFQQQLAYKDLGYTYLYDDAVEKAYSLGRTGNIAGRIRDIIQLRKTPSYIELQPYYEETILQDLIEKLSEYIEKEPKNATIQRQNGNFIITKEELGIKIDESLLIERIINGINSHNEEDIIIPTISTVPDVTEEKLKNIQEVIGEFSTIFNPKVEGRSHNIARAAKSINGTLIMPGEEFSFNETTGPASAEQGYQEAPVIINGEFSTGVGGGVCQVSTTLYNAVVRGNLDVTSRRNHSLSVAYVPLGHDAAVAYNHLDFKFKNNLQNPVYIESYIAGDRVYAKLYGKKEEEITISLVSDVLEVIEPKVEIIKDPTMPIGERKVEREAKKGYRVVTYKVYYQNGKEIKREQISKDYYSPVDGKIIEGTKAKPMAEEVPVLDHQPKVEGEDIIEDTTFLQEDIIE